MAGYIGNMMDIRNQSTDLWTKMLKEAQGLQSGNINPWDLPEFQQYKELFQNMMDKFGKNLYSNASSRGMNPGALMDQLGEQGIKGMNQGMTSMFTEAMNRVPQYAKGGMDQYNQFIKNYLQGEQLDQQQDMYSEGVKNAWINKFVGATTGGLAGAGAAAGGDAMTKNPSTGVTSGSPSCCFIMIQGEGLLTNHVRQTRDHYISTHKNGSRVKKGYLRMASKIVPWMKESRIVQNLVRFVMTKPISIFSSWFKSRKGGGFVFAPIAIAWLIVWDIMGSK
jgi:hypothetical protein